MKIKAAVVKEVGDPFEIKDDIELHEVGPTDLQIHMVASGICHSASGKAMPQLATLPF